MVISWKYILMRALAFFAGILLVFTLQGCGNKTLMGSEAKNENECPPPRPQPAPDGSVLTLSVEREGICQLAHIKPDGTGLTVLIQGDKAKINPSYSPDGKSLVYSGPLGNTWGLFLLDVQNGRIRQITYPSEELDAYPSFSPNGKQIVFVRAFRHRPYSLGGWSWNDLEVCVVNADGSGEKRLTNERFYDASPPYFSPDGNHIVFAATPLEGAGVNRMIFLLGVASGHLRKLTYGNSYDFDPAFSPDGKTIVFSSDRRYDTNRPYGYEIWTISASGGHTTRLTSLKKSFSKPCYLPDNSAILFVNRLSDNKGYELWRIDPDGKNPHCITRRSILSDK